VARVVITAAADADAAAIADDLAARAGATIAARYDADFDAFYQRLKQFPESGAPRRTLGATSPWASCFPMSFFTATLRPTTPFLCFAFCTAAAKSPAECCNGPRYTHDLIRRPTCAAIIGWTCSPIYSAAFTGRNDLTVLAWLFSLADKQGQPWCRYPESLVGSLPRRAQSLLISISYTPMP
jgi:plasmid stabilization system protein ParE